MNIYKNKDKALQIMRNTNRIFRAAEKNSKKNSKKSCYEITVLVDGPINNTWVLMTISEAIDNGFSYRIEY